MFPVALSPPRNPGTSQDTQDGETSSFPAEQWMGSSNDEPWGHSSSCEVTSGSVAAWKYSTCPMSDHFDVFKDDTLKWRFRLFLFVFSFAKALMGPRFFCSRCHLNLMNWGAELNMHALLHVNVHPNLNSHTKELKQKNKQMHPWFHDIQVNSNICSF